MPLLAVADGETPAVHIYDGRGETQTPTETIQGIHKSSITEMAYNNQHDCVISADASGMIEYWSPSSSAHEKPASVFQYKSSTDLFEFRKARSTPVCIAVSPTGAHFATLSFPDRRVRVFGFASGKLHRSYDESLRTLTEMQQAGTALRQLDAFDFGRRLAVERDLEPQPQQKKQPQASSRTRPNVLFDESGHFLLYGSLHGTKVINILTNRVVRVFGADEALRAAHLALYQGAPGRSVVTAAMAASANPLLREAEERDPLLVCTAAGKARFYIFSNDDKASKAERDVQNEKPKQLGAGAGAREAEAKKRAESSGTAAVLHTTFGDIHLRLFPEAAPKAVENFATHARSGYYNNTIFHRVIRKFMIQGGDPLGDGTGGESIWGREFEDEFSTLRHDKPYTVSMANAGPNTNGSQVSSPFPPSVPMVVVRHVPWLLLTLRRSSSSSRRRSVRGWTRSTPSSGARCRAWTSCTASRTCGCTRKSRRRTSRSCPSPCLRRCRRAYRAWGILCLGAISPSPIRASA